jgi:hypothetical protein
MPHTNDPFDHAVLSDEGEKELKKELLALYSDEEPSKTASIVPAEQSQIPTKTEEEKVKAKTTIKPVKPGSISEFISSMSEAGGFARTSRFTVRINLPTTIVATEMTRQLTLHCDSVSMPGHDLQAQDVQHGSAPGRMMVQSHDYAGNISASFYLDRNLSERVFFELWQAMCVDKTSHKAHYYDDYIGSMEIFQLDLQNNPVYGMKLSEVYPTTIGSTEYGNANANQVAKLNVEFAYREWKQINLKAELEANR